MGEIQVAGVSVAAVEDPRWIPIRVSRINLALTLGGAAVAFPLLFVVPIAPAMRAALCLAFALAMAFDLVLTLLRVPHSATAFYLFDIAADSPSPKPNPAGDAPALGIRVRFRGRADQTSAPEHDGTVSAGSFVTPWFTALRYRLPQDPAWRRLWPRVIPLWPDSIGVEDFRRTRVALKWK